MRSIVDFFNLSRQELISSLPNFSASEHEDAREIIDAIKNKNATQLLKKLEKKGLLKNFVIQFEELKKQRPEDILLDLQNDKNNKIIDIILRIHTLWIIKNRDTIKWPKPIIKEKVKKDKIKKLITSDVEKKMYDFLIDQIKNIPHEIGRLSPSQWAEKKRILPQGLTSLPGQFRWETTPYLREIIDCFSYSSSINKVAIMKGSQLGFSVGVLENLIGWIIDCEPGPTLFVTADKDLAQSIIETRIDRMIESAGIQNKIFSQVEKKHGKNTGDTKSKKEFSGGFLLPIGPNVAGKLRSYSIKNVFFDEVDGFPLEVGNEGDPLKLAERRTDAFSQQRKILYISTPTIEDSSRIKPLFENGTKEYFFIPCKFCQHFQQLQWNQIKFETDAHGRLIWDTVYYECENCKGHLKNTDKAQFLISGRWQATTTAIEPNFRSFHLSSLYSPIGFRPWESIVQEWLQIKDEPARLRVFINTVLGEPWQERGEAPRWERLMLKREDNITGDLPQGAHPLVLTLGADVQADRIEAELVAWGAGKESWSVGYFILEGDTSDLDGRAWKGLSQLIENEHVGITISMALIDAGFRTSVVYQFCEQYSSGVFPCMGESTQYYGRRIFALRTVPGYAVQRVDIQTSQLKSELYGYLQKNPGPDGTYPSGYCHFPSDYTEKHFKQLTAEERVKEKLRSGAVRYVWKQIRERNEQLDARVYNMAALYVLASIVQAEISPDEVIDWSTFWKIISGEKELQ